MTWQHPTLNDRRDARVAQLWAQGLDTFEMALRLGCHEAEVCRSLARVRMQQRDARRRSW